MPTYYITAAEYPEDGLGDLFHRILSYSTTEPTEYAPGYIYGTTALDLAALDEPYREFWWNTDTQEVWIWDRGMPDPVDPTDTALLAASVRDRRDAMLDECDWTQLPDVVLTAACVADFATYRQALRDVPQQAGFPLNITWPVRPAEVNQGGI